jgi:hypothetical protein
MANNNTAKQTTLGKWGCRAFLIYSIFLNVVVIVSLFYDAGSVCSNIYIGCIGILVFAFPILVFIAFIDLVAALIYLSIFKPKRLGKAITCFALVPVCWILFSVMSTRYTPFQNITNLCPGVLPGYSPPNFECIFAKLSELSLIPAILMPAVLYGILDLHKKSRI